MDIQRYRAQVIIELLMYIDTVEPGSVYPQKLNAFPDSRVRQSGAPVPSEHIMTLADLGETAHGIFCSLDRRICGILLGNEPDRGVECDLELVFSGLKKFSDRKVPHAVHVVCAADPVSVQGDVRDRIEAVKAKQHLVVFGYRVQIGIKGAAVHEIVIHESKGRVLVVPVVGIGKAARAYQIVIYRSGNGCVIERFLPRDPHFPPLL